MSWDWYDYAKKLCYETCVNKCREQGYDAPRCPFTDEFEECEKLYNAAKKLEKEYFSMLRSGVDEDDPRLVQLEDLYDRAGEVYDSAYASLRNAVEEDHWREDDWCDWLN